MDGATGVSESFVAFTATIAETQAAVAALTYAPRPDYFSAPVRSGVPALDTDPLFIDDLADPVLTVPINLAAFMDLDNGRAWVGFTAATGRSMQNHDVQSFPFRERVGGSFVPGVAVA